MMKKCLPAAALLVLLLLPAPPASAKENPFSELPADHWAYDALSSLAKDKLVTGPLVQRLQDRLQQDRLGRVGVGHDDRQIDRRQDRIGLGGKRHGVVAQLRGHHFGLAGIVIDADVQIGFVEDGAVLLAKPIR